jgi:hypothetical protein
VIANVGGGEHHRLAELLALWHTPDDRGDFEAAVVADAGDPVALAIDRPTPVALQPGEIPAVRARFDEIPDTGIRALQPERHPVLGDDAEPDQFSAQGRRQPSRLLVGIDQEQ